VHLQKKDYGNFFSKFLFIFKSRLSLVGASYLILKQLPRLSGHLVEFNSPRFTKVGAGILASIGIGAGIICAFRALYLVREWLNGDAVWTHAIRNSN
jgi:hypothetical protein